jgi:hypothetical protein
MATKTAKAKAAPKTKKRDLSKFTKGIPSIPTEIVRAFNHEIRRAILGILNEGTSSPRRRQAECFSTCLAILSGSVE